MQSKMSMVYASLVLISTLAVKNARVNSRMAPLSATGAKMAMASTRMGNALNAKEKISKSVNLKTIIKSTRCVTIITF